MASPAEGLLTVLSILHYFSITFIIKRSNYRNMITFAFFCNGTFSAIGGTSISDG